ncbi:hypothetical protein J2W43_002651 [Pseudomonas brassicacearum]|uniref:Uncharacterized protein n=1 Tax=Pseudomonas brassicacearum TaxID=930166 RepID=A0AAW8MAY0_9PSED|nr:hypothetical protein [Pseudomonas brassicacearum]
MDRSHAPAWERRQGRSAFRFCKVTQSVTGCIPTQSVGTINDQHPLATQKPCSARVEMNESALIQTKALNLYENYYKLRH